MKRFLNCWVGRRYATNVAESRLTRYAGVDPIKHSDWSHENEVRFVTPRAGPLPILGQVLKRVYYVRTDFPEWGPVMMLMHQLYPNVELAKLTFQHIEPYVKVQDMTKKLVPFQE